MANTKTNNLGLEFAAESATLGELPGSPEWKDLEPNSIGTYGASISTVTRDPISRNRQRQKGTIVDLDSTVEFDADLTYDMLEDFLPYFMYADFQDGPTIARPTSSSTTAYTVPAMAAALPEDTIIRVRGFANSANNGVKLVDVAGTTTSIPVQGGGLIAETPAATRNATVEVCGFRFATGDLEVDANGDLITTTKDLTTLALTVGQSIWIGGSDSANQFATTANAGFAQVVTIATNKLTLAKRSQAFSTDNGAGKDVELYFGRYIKNVPTDDAKFRQTSLQMEARYEDLQNPSGTGDEYEYAKGNRANSVTIDFPLTDKATMSLGFAGTDTPPPTTTRATNAGSPLARTSTAAMNTTSDLARLRIQEIDETGLTTDFKSVSLTINNDATPQKALGRLGALDISYGKIQVDLEAQAFFNDSDVSAAIRNNTTVTMDWAIKNDDGGALFDLYEVTLGDGSKEFPVNEDVLINTTVESFEDSTYNASLGVSLFPFLP